MSGHVVYCSGHQMTRHETDIRTRVARNIDAAIDASGISAAELARRLGLNEKTVRRWRSGEVTPGLERLAEVAAALDSEDILDFYAEGKETVGAG